MGGLAAGLMGGLAARPRSRRGRRILRRRDRGRGRRILGRGGRWVLGRGDRGRGRRILRRGDRGRGRRILRRRGRRRIRRRRKEATLLLLRDHVEGRHEEDERGGETHLRIGLVWREARRRRGSDGAEAAAGKADAVDP